MMMHDRYSYQDLNLKSFSIVNERESDLILEMRNHPAVASWMTSSAVIDRESHKRFMVNQSSEARNFNFLVYDADGVAGVVSLHRVDWSNEIAWLGIYKNPFRVEKGLGRKILKAVCYLAFEVAKLHTFKIEVVSNNAAAIRAYSATGFKNEGAWREAVKCDSGYLDLVLMGMTFSEWAGHDKK